METISSHAIAVINEIEAHMKRVTPILKHHEWRVDCGVMGTTLEELYEQEKQLYPDLLQESFLTKDSVDKAIAVEIMNYYESKCPLRTRGASGLPYGNNGWVRVYAYLVNLKDQ
jgi:hypothetical protein